MTINKSAQVACQPSLLIMNFIKTVALFLRKRLELESLFFKHIPMHALFDHVFHVTIIITICFYNLIHKELILYYRPIKDNMLNLSTLSLQLMTILYIDDDDDDREIFADAVKAIDPNISYIDFSESQIALDYLIHMEVVPNFIFLDINIPKMNGYELVKELRSHEIFKDTEIIMYTTSCSAPNPIGFEQLHVQVIEKATSFKDVIFIIKNVIASQEMGELR